MSYFSSFPLVQNLRLLLVYCHCSSLALFSLPWDCIGLYSLTYFMDSDRIHLLEAQIRLSHFLTSRHLMTCTACSPLSKPSGLELVGDPQRRTPAHSRVYLSSFTRQLSLWIKSLLTACARNFWMPVFAPPFPIPVLPFPLPI